MRSDEDFTRALFKSRGEDARGEDAPGPETDGWLYHSSWGKYAIATTSRGRAFVLWGQGASEAARQYMPSFKCAEAVADLAIALDRRELDVASVEIENDRAVLLVRSEAAPRVSGYRVHVLRDGTIDLPGTGYGTRYSVPVAAAVIAQMVEALYAK